MRPFINWAGSREEDLDVLLPLVPKGIKTFVDPFVGDGALALAVDAPVYLLADTNEALVNAWKVVLEGGPRLRSILPGLARVWQNADSCFGEIRESLLELWCSVEEGLYPDYLKMMSAIVRIADRVQYDTLFPVRMSEPMEFKIELRRQIAQTLEEMPEGEDDESVATAFLTAFKEAVFNYLVEVYNKPESKYVLRAALLIFLMEYARGNRYVEDDGEFRPSYAGRKVNHRPMRERMDILMNPELLQRMRETKVYRQDLFRTLGYGVTRERGSFLFLDTLRASARSREATSQKRLAGFLRDGTKAHWMAVCRPGDVLDKAFPELRSVPLGDDIVLMNY